MANLNEDISVPSAGLLAAASEAGMTEGQTCYVATYGDTFQWHPYQTVPAVPNVVINGPTGQWTRMGVPNAKWQAQATWSIDESNVSGLASDENSGIDDAHPLLNIDEFIRRMGLGNITSMITVRWLSDTTHDSVNLGNVGPGNFVVGLSSPLILFKGVPTVIRSGTLTGATTAPWTVSDSSLPTSWSASGCLSTSSGTRWIRNVAQTAFAAMGYENVAKTASNSPHNAFLPTYPFAGTQVGTFSNGDSYEVISLPKFPSVSCSTLGVGSNGINLFNLDLKGIGAGAVQMINCGFRAFALTNSSLQAGGIFGYGVMFVSGGGISGLSSTIDRCLVTGSSLQFSRWAGDLNGATNVVAKAGSIQASHGSIGRLGTIYAFDNTVVNGALFVNTSSNVMVDAIHGSGNTQLIVNVRDSGCSINSPATTPLTAFDATTSALHPISVTGTQFDYTAIPITVPAKNASFTTN